MSLQLKITIKPAAKCVSISATEACMRKRKDTSTGSMVEYESERTLGRSSDIPCYVPNTRTINAKNGTITVLDKMPLYPITEYARACIERMVAPTAIKALKVILAREWNEKIENLLKEAQAYRKSYDMNIEEYERYAHNLTGENNLQAAKLHKFTMKKHLVSYTGESIASKAERKSLVGYAIKYGYKIAYNANKTKAFLIKRKRNKSVIVLRLDKNTSKIVTERKPVYIKHKRLKSKQSIPVYKLKRHEIVPHYTIEKTTYAKELDTIHIADGTDVEDVFQIVRESLCELVAFGLANTPAQLKELRVYAFRCVHAYIRGEKRIMYKCESLTKDENENGENENQTAENDVATVDNYKDVDRESLFTLLESEIRKKASGHINEKSMDNIILTLYWVYMHGVSTRTVASRLDIDQKQVCRYINQIKKTLYSVDVLTAIHDMFA